MIVNEIIWLILDPIKDFLDNKTWRLRHLWTHRHVAFKLSLDYNRQECIRCFRYQQRKDKGELV